ncbi:MAG TPA: BTAD domain-containing putative transcriptional regulator, partial [Gemmatimonadaceae bacterium]|nr:BTAD domain-containing putative transcriptional regulator [Gemmatimonadaceae bacterium]
MDASVEFEEWLERERRELNRLAISAYETVARHAMSNGDHQRAADAWLRSLELDPGSAHATLGLMLALSGAGDRAASLRAADDYATFMKREYDATPNAEVQALVERIRARNDPVAAQVSAALEVPAPRGSAVVPEAPASVSAPATSDGAALPKRNTRRRNRVSAVVAAAVLMGAATLTAWLRREAIEPFAIGMTRMVAGGPELEMDAAISPDGKLVAYAAGPLGAMRIFIRQVDGGAAVPISDRIKGTHRWPRWSPNGTQLLFVALDSGLANSASNGVAYLVPYMGGTPEVAFSSRHLGVLTPAWAPDGRHIAYGDGDELVIHSLDDGESRSVVNGNQLYSPAFSPDGTRLAYVSGNVLGETLLNIAASSIWTVPISGGTPVRLTDSTHSNVSPVWASDGHSIFYVTNALGVSDVFRQRVSSDGQAIGRATRLTTGLEAAGFSLSADQRRAAYSVARQRSHIWAATIPRSGTTPDSAIEQITNEAEAIEGLDISRDGKWLVYDSDRGGNQDIYKLRIGEPGSAPIQLTHDPAPDHVPQWSPNGREIAYYSERAGNRDIRVMSAEGHDDRAVTTSPLQEHDATWSPDGRSLAFVAGGYGLPVQIVVASRDSQGAWLAPRQLTNETSAAQDAGPNLTRWSPDGRWIAFKEHRSLEVISPQTGMRRVLVRPGQIDGRETSGVAWGRSGDT